MAKDKVNPEVKDTSAVVEGEHDAKGLTKEQKEYGVTKEELRGKVAGEAVAAEPTTSFDERTVGTDMPWEQYNRDKIEADAKASDKAREAAPTVRDEDNPVKTGAAQARESARQADPEDQTGGHPGARVSSPEQKASK